MAKQEKVQVDEDFMKEIISQGLPMKQEISPKAVSKEPDTPEVIQETVEEPVRNRKQKPSGKLPAGRKVPLPITGKPISRKWNFPTASRYM